MDNTRIKVFEVRANGIYISWGKGTGDWIVHKKYNLMESVIEKRFIVRGMMNFTDPDKSVIAFYYVERLLSTMKGIGNTQIGIDFVIS